MKFPRNAKIFRGQLDVAPFAGVFFILVMFLLVASLIYTPGVRMELPVAASDLAGVDGPTIAVGLGPNGQFYFENQIVREEDLAKHLAAAVQKSPQPLTLVV